MCTVISNRTVKARKIHRCMALDCIKECGLDDVLSYIEPDEYLELSNLLQNDGKILPGEEYRIYAMAGNGTVQTIKESLIGAKLCQKYDLYPESC